MLVRETPALLGDCDVQGLIRDIADDGRLTVTLRDARGIVLYTRELSPER